MNFPINHYIYDTINQTKNDYSFDKTVIDFFEEQVKKNPQKIAVISEGQTLSYEELNTKANAVAHKLRSINIGKNDIVPIWMHRSCEMIIAVFGIMKSGAAYLPLDRSSPPERLLYILKDAGACCLLSRQEEPLIQEFFGEVLYVDNPELNKERSDNPEKINHGHDLAYICYTSGSTGLPKGVQIEHHSLINRLEWMQSKFLIEPNDRLFQKTAFFFDVSIWEIFLWAMGGASVVLLPPGKEQDPRLMVKMIKKHLITIIHFVPSVLEVFLDYLSYQSENMISSLKWVFSSGESLHSNLVHQFYDVFTNQATACLVNLYGPTEATIDVSYFICLPNKIYDNIPIGRPIQNTRLYVLSENHRLADIGEVGELLIAGVGIARGYLNDMANTSKKFVSMPKISEKRVYKTGDLVKLNQAGELLYLGRMDDQVKIRGLRIELGEIETHLNQHLAIKNSVVLAIRNSMKNPVLIAFVILKESMLSDLELVEFLASKIPSYMLPQQYHFLKSFPIKNNGKLDKKKLEKLWADQEYESLNRIEVN